MENRYSKEKIESLYNELKSIKNVAEYIGVPYSTLYYWMRNYGIKMNEKRSVPYSEEELQNLYIKYGSLFRISAEMHIPYTTVQHWFSVRKIKVQQSHNDVFKGIRETPMTDVQKSVILGSVLGDGGLWLAPHSKNARCYFIHCEKQKGYLEWVNKLLIPYSRPIRLFEKEGRKFVCGRYVNASNFYRFWTIAHPDITDFFHRYYRSGKKGVSPTLLDEVDLLAVAIWVADDGSVQLNKSGDVINASIATCSFTMDEHEILRYALSRFFKGRIEIKKHGGKDRTDLVLNLCGAEHVREFINMIKSVLPKCIHYKLGSPTTKCETPLLVGDDIV